MKEKYCFDIPEGGAASLNLLDYCFNTSTQDFLLKAGLTEGMHVLELGCGSGKMSCWIAKQIGEKGQLIAIDNNPHQIDAAKNYAEHHGINHINFQCLDAYKISEFQTQFDLIYCRFLLHHLSKPRTVIHDIYNLLKVTGIAALEEGIVNQAFSYPYNMAFGTERFELSDHHDNFEGMQRDGNFGIKLYYSLYEAGFKQLTLKIVAPTLISRNEKAMLKDSLLESKQNAIENGLSAQAWQEKLNQLERLIENDGAIVGFYQSAQVSGRKMCSK